MSFAVANNTKLVEPEFKNEAWLCKRVINKTSGHATYPSKDPLQKWELVYKWAKQNPDQFDIEMMSDVTSPVDEDGNITWVKEDLDRMSFPELKKVGQGLSVTARDKDTLVKRILAKQSNGGSEEE